MATSVTRWHHRLSIVFTILSIINAAIAAALTVSGASTLSIVSNAITAAGCAMLAALNRAASRRQARKDRS